jgi:osmoprotectant transport system permease protein
MSLFADPRWSEAFAHLPDYLGNHVRVSVTALALGLLVSLPLAVAARNQPVMRGLLLGLASVVQTVPGLALLALFYPLLLALAALSLAWFGYEFSAFGFLPAVLALALYSMLPVLRNTITGLRGVDPAILEAAQGVGMTQRQSLFMVELPLALPVMMAGIRTAAVWVIGTATLSTPIGQTSLGNYIFAGLQTQNWVFVLFGCLAAAVLALAVDQLLALIETGIRNRSRVRTALGGIGIAALAAATLVPSMARSPTSYIVGAKTFAEQYVLSALIAQRLRAAGLSATSREGLGSNVIFDALASGDIDVYVDYSGTLWANQFHHSDIKPREQLLGELKAILAQQNIMLLGELGFENAYALVMPRKRAEQLGIHSIADLASHAPVMSMAADYEFFSRPEWAGLQKAYGLTFRAQRQMQPDFMYAAVAAGEVDVIAGYTSDGLIAKYDLVVLDDPKHAIPPYDAIVLIAPKRAGDQALRAALQPLLGKIDIATMREANLRAAGGDGASSPDAVARWLWEKIGKSQGSGISN